MRGYDAQRDPDDNLLEALMTTPMLVTHWVDWQHHASTCAPTHLGSGNKVLHNVMGGHTGVSEGNGGDLRIGPSQQSVHGGERWLHEPLRLTVVIDAPRPSIDAVVHQHAVVKQLVDHGWLHPWRWGGTDLMRYDQGLWEPLHTENW